MNLERRHFLHSLPVIPAASQLLFSSTHFDSYMTQQSVKPAARKMVLIGAGSAMFTQGVIIDWIHRHFKDDWEIALVDINPVILEATEKLVRRYMLSAEKPAKVTASTDRRDVLSGSEFVVSTIGVGSRRAWEQDVFVPRKFGIFQPVGDTVMPGGVSRAMRMIPPMLDIARDVVAMCPQARFVNFSNPMTAVVRAIRRETSLKVIGLCHGLQSTLQYLAKLAGTAMSDLTAKWCGLNHLTWITEVRSNGKNLWPRVRAAAAAAGTNPFSWQLYDEFGGFPAPNDRHTTEFFPERFSHGQYYGKVLGVDAYSFEETIARGDKIYEGTIGLSKGEGPVDDRRLRSTGGEHSQLMDIFDSWEQDARRWYSANVPNDGAVANLCRDAVLEVPVIAERAGMLVPPVGEISPRLAAILLRRLAAVEATVEAAVKGDRKLFTEAIILDGAVPDYATAERLGNELIRAQKQYLPQFA